MKVTPVIALLMLLAWGGCDEVTDPRDEIRVRSLAFSEGEVIPAIHTCHGRGISPPLSFSWVPDEAEELVIIMEDLDYITGPHTEWMVWGLPAKVILPEDIDKNLPEGAVQGLAEDAELPGYKANAPCPTGAEHRFQIQALAVDKPIRLEEVSGRKQLDEAIDGHIVGRGALTGRVPPKQEK